MTLDRRDLLIQGSGTLAAAGIGLALAARPSEASAATVAVLALHRKSIGLVMSDPLWAKFKLGEKLDVTDQVTKEKSLRCGAAIHRAQAAGAGYSYVGG